MDRETGCGSMPEAWERPGGGGWLRWGAVAGFAQPWAGLAAGAAGAGCLVAGRALGRRGAALRRLQRDQLERLPAGASGAKLADLREGLAGKLPQVVVVTGKAHTGEAMRAEGGSKEGPEGVVLQTLVENYWIKANASTGQWDREASTVADYTLESPWWLADGSGFCVPVVDAKTADRLDLVKVYESFDSPAGSNLMKQSLDYMRGLKLLGSRKRQYMLPVDTPLTVVGELFEAGSTPLKTLDRKDFGGWAGNPRGLVIGQPTGKNRRLPFIVSQKPLPELLAELSALSRRFYWTGAALGALSALLSVRQVLAHFRMRRRVALFRAQMAEARQELEEGDADLDTEELCVVCLAKPYDTVFPRCGHLCVCQGCAFRMGRCPICRTASRPIRTFRP